jgi:hypothetical protein
MARAWTPQAEERHGEQDEEEAEALHGQLIFRHVQAFFRRIVRVASGRVTNR